MYDEEVMFRKKSESESSKEAPQTSLIFDQLGLGQRRDPPSLQHFHRGGEAISLSDEMGLHVPLQIWTSWQLTVERGAPGSVHD